MEAVLWGVRGSLPAPSQTTRFYGSNTSCLEVRPDPQTLVILDAGTGINLLSKTLPDAGECHIFITHGHSDHIQGLPFFQPFYRSGWTVNIYVPEDIHGLMDTVFNGKSFPLRQDDLAATVREHTVAPGKRITIEGKDAPIHIEVYSGNHPGGSLAYKVISQNAAMLYSGDHEITSSPAVRDMTAAMLDGVRLAVVDAMFSRADYRAGWGHSAWEDWADAAESAGVEMLLISHHEPDKTDAELDALQKRICAHSQGVTRLGVAREGMRFALPGPLTVGCKTSSWLDDFIASLADLKEETALLDRILSKAREIANADAGSIYLAEGNELVFAYSQNDTLFPRKTDNKSMYVNMRLPIAQDSIAGFVAATGKELNLQDVHDIPATMPFSFNDSFDKKTGYRTVSMLTLPIAGTDHKVLGVLQLINSQVPGTKDVEPFSEAIVESVRTLAREASKFLEISEQVSHSVNRLLRIAMLHDPSETGPHAERVGAISAEIYQHWAAQKGLPQEEVRVYKGQLRLAAMVHDIGKVGIPNEVLKKPGKLTDDEFAIIKKHTGFGSELFTVDSRDIAGMAHEISLHHHQKWNGKGYPPVNGVCPAGTDIPLSARITAIADVFDALVSPRCYKEPWSFERATNLLKEEAGQHFDPELVESFTEILDTVAMIYDRYPDEKLPEQNPPA